MQSTLLGLAIAAILALVTALVGPLFVDWGRYRANIEAEASRMAGQPVRISGAIDVRLLPTPTIFVREVQIGSRAAPAFSAQAVRAELALDGLMRGELRAAALTLNGPEIAAGLDRNGRLVTHLRTLGFDAERISIDRLAVTDGRLVLEDAASGTRVTLDKVVFGGEVRPQNGQVKGDGTFTVAGQAFHYQVATGRRDAGTRFRFNLEPAERPLAFETEGTLSFDNDAPKFEGTASLARPAGVVLASGKTVASEPWRISGRVRADASHALFEQVEAQYGPDERRLRLGGTAEFRFGAQLRLESVLSARQIDLDRALAAAGTTSQLPLAALGEIFDSIGSAARPPFAMKLGIGIDALALGGATLQSLRADISSEKDVWSIDNIEFRAPGVTQVRLSGRVGGAPGGAEFSGPVAVESSDPGVLMAWLEGATRPRGMVGALKMRSDVTVSDTRAAFDRIAADVNGKPVEGRVAYIYPLGAQRARLDVAVKAAELDLESAYGIVSTLLAGSKVERPGEVSLSVDLGRATFAGFTATSTNAVLRLDGGGLRIERLQIADFGGAALTGSGDIEIGSSQPHGAVAMKLTAAKLDSIAALVQRLSPEAGEVVARNATRLAPAQIDATLRIDPQANGSAAAARLSLNGQLGSLRVALSGEGTGNVAAPATSDVKLDARLTSDDGALVSLLGLDTLAPAAAQRRSAALNVRASGPANGDLRVEARFAGEGFDLGGAGTIRFADAALSGVLSASLSSADLAGVRRPGGPPLPVAMKSAVKIASKTLNFTALEGRAGGSNIKGQLSVAYAFGGADTTASSPQKWSIDGKIAVDTLDAAGVLAAILGAPNVANAQTSAWPAQSFKPTIFSASRGRIEIDAARAALLPAIAAQKLHGVMNFAANDISFEGFTASLGGGQATGQARFERGDNGLVLRGRATLADADATSVIRSGAQAPVSGQLGGELTFEGVGTSPAALIAGLNGVGSITLTNGKIAGMDPRAIEAAARTLEQGAPMSPPRITETVTRALDGGALAVASASAPIELTNGRARLGKIVMRGASDAAAAASLDLADQVLDARFTLTNSSVSDAQGLRPELIVLFKGPLDAPRRSIDINPLMNWLTLQSVERESKRLEAEERAAKRREEFEARMREEERQREAARAAVGAPPVTGTTLPPVSAETPPRPAPSGLFAPELPVPQFIPARPQAPASAALTAPQSPSPAIAPPPVSTLSPQALIPRGENQPVRPEQNVSAPASLPVAQPDEVGSNVDVLPSNPPLPPRRPGVTGAPTQLAPPFRPSSRNGYGQQHNAPQ